MKKEMIACQCYSLRNMFGDEAEADKTLAAVKEIGYDAVQLSGIWHLKPELLKRLCVKHGLEVCATHISFDRLENDLQRVIEEHKMMECHYVGIGSMPQNCRQDETACRRFIEDMNKYGEIIRKNGLELVYHNHSFEFDNKFGGESIMDIIFENIRSFQFELDTCWVYNGKEDPAKLIRKVAPHMEIVHFKDIRYAKDGAVILSEVGSGLLEWNGIVNACRDTNIRWYIVEQDTCPGNPLDSMKQSFDYLMGMV